MQAGAGREMESLPRQMLCREKYTKEGEIQLLVDSKFFFAKVFFFFFLFLHK